MCFVITTVCCVITMMCFVITIGGLCYNNAHKNRECVMDFGWGIIPPPQNTTNNTPTFPHFIPQFSTILTIPEHIMLIFSPSRYHERGFFYLSQIPEKKNHILSERGRDASLLDGSLLTIR